MRSDRFATPVGMIYWRADFLLPLLIGVVSLIAHPIYAQDSEHDCPFALGAAGVLDTARQAFRSYQLMRIAENKRSTKLRLGFANWIEDDYSDYSNFIRAQLEIEQLQEEVASSASSADQISKSQATKMQQISHLMTLETRFLNSQLTRLVPPGMPANSLSFWRGFPSEITFDAQNFEATPEQLQLKARFSIAMLPTLDGVGLYNVHLLPKTKLNGLLAAVAVGRIEFLRLAPFTVPTALLLRKESASLDWVTTLKVHNMIDESYQALCGSSFPSLDTLELHGGDLEFTPSARPLLEASFFEQLKSLSIVDTPVSHHFIHDLANSNTSLMSIDFSGAGVNDRGIESFIHSPLAARVRYVDFSGDGYTDRGAALFVKAMSGYGLDISHQQRQGSRAPQLIAYIRATGPDEDDSGNVVDDLPTPPQPPPTPFRSRAGDVYQAN